MLRFFTASALSLVALSTLNAGQIIPIGGANGLLSTATAGYVVNATASSCTGHALNPSVTCLTTNSQGVALGPSAWTAKSYSNALFGTPTLAGGAPALPLAGSTLGPFDLNAVVGASAVALADFGQVAGGGIAPGLYSLVIPVGINGVTGVDTLLQDFWAAGTAPSLAAAITAGLPTTGYSTSVTFEFDTTSDGSSGSPIFDTIFLQNGFQIRGGVDCTNTAENAVLPTTPSSTTVACGSTATNTTAPTTTLALGSQALGDANVTATNLYSAAYTRIGTGAFAGTTQGNLLLDEQAFDFGSKYLSDYLVAVIVNNQMTPGLSKVEVSAVSVVQAAPEPTTLLLLLTGLGSIGLGRFGRKK